MTAQAARRIKGEVSYHAGQAAEAAVARHYEKAGYTLLAQRWRGTSGEIDLIFRASDQIVCVEVKKSRSVLQAASHLTPRQIHRLIATSQEFLARQPKGLLTELRFDVALVESDGKIFVIENAIGEL